MVERERIDRYTVIVFSHGLIESWQVGMITLCDQSEEVEPTVPLKQA